MLPRGLWTNDYDVHTLAPRERAVKTPAMGPASFSGLRLRSIGGLRYGLRSFFPENRLTFPGGNGCGRRGNGSFPRLRGTFPKGNQRFPRNAHGARAVHVLFPVPLTMRGPGNGPFPLWWEVRSAGNAMGAGPRLSFPGGNGSRRRGNAARGRGTGTREAGNGSWRAGNVSLSAGNEAGGAVFEVRRCDWAL